ncbi:hypothetical protein ACGFYQ_20790 [Streptomyces sp. NPDC048258]|uniref:hypothetical protein n=1 Tax=Streptomyces sp. NPDC048258 TaxID=3365527 RepID=UPI00371B710D
MGYAGLGFWILTAGIGGYLLTVWLREGGWRQRAVGITRLPVPVILAHILLAVVGLCCWTLFTFSRADSAGRAASALVLIVASLGAVLLFRWLPSRGRHSRDGDAAAERNFPVAAVVTHGVSAVLTVIIVVTTVIYAT